MSNKEQLFNELINQSLKQLEGIIDPKDKVLAMTSIAQAVAISNIFNGNSTIEIDKSELNTVDKNTVEDVGQEEVVTNKEEQEEANTEENMVEQEENVDEETTEDVEEIATFTTNEELPDPNIKEQDEPITAPEPKKRVWDEESVMEFKEEVAELKSITEKIGLEEMTKLVSDFSQGFLVNGLQDLLPNNIEAFLIYARQNLD